MLLQLPSIPDNAIIEYQVVIPYSVLSAPQNTFTYFWKTDGNTNSLGIPGGYYVCGTCIRVIDQFKGGTITSLTCSLGAFVPGTILSDITYYGMAYELTALPSSQSFQISGPSNNNLNNFTIPYAPATGLYFNGPHDVAAYFTSTGANLSALTAGTVEITVQIRPL